MYLAIVACVLPGCFATPVPDPPDLEPPVEDLVSADPMEFVVPTPVHVIGAPGAALPGATVHVTPLGSTAPVASGLVEADGSFRVTLEAGSREVVRVSLRYELLRAVPIDLRVPDAPGPMIPVMQEACLISDPPRELEIVDGAVGEPLRSVIVLRNECAGALSIAARLRAPSSVISIETPASFSVAAGESAEVEIGFDPPGIGTYESIVLFDVTGAITETRPVTVFGRVPSDE